MEYLKPPTDNLYKFIAIAGLITAIVAYIWPIQIAYEKGTDIDARQQAYSVMKQIATEARAYKLVLLLNTVSKEDSSAIAHIPIYNDPPLGDPNTVTSKDTKHVWRNYHKTLANVYATATMFTYTDFRVIIEKPESKAAREELGLQDDKNSVENIRRAYESFQEAVGQARNEETERFYDLEQIWRDEDYVARCKAEGESWFMVGCYTTIAGFALWWLMLQRHQDLMLRLERNKAVEAAKYRAIPRRVYKALGTGTSWLLGFCVRLLTYGGRAKKP